MNHIRSAFLLLATGLAVAVGQPAAAQTITPPATAPATTAAPATVGMMVKDVAGGAVGSVTAVADGFVTVKTDKHDVKLPAASFTAANGGLLYGMTQAQLNADVEKQLAEAQAQFKTGATVRGSAGEEVGTVTALDAESVTVKTVVGKTVRLPRSGVAPGTTGLAIGMTAAQLDAAAGPATATATTTKTTKASASKKATVKKKRK